MTDEKKKDDQHIIDYIEVNKPIKDMNEIELLRYIAKSSNRTSLNVAFFFWLTVASFFLTIYYLIITRLQ